MSTAPSAGPLQRVIRQLRVLTVKAGPTGPHCSVLKRHLEASADLRDGGTTRRSDAMAYQLHPLAARYPRMTGKDFDLLVADIRKHGVRDPLVLLDGKLLDGRFKEAHEDS